MINLVWVPIGVRYGIPMREFYALNPTLVMRYQPFMAKQLEKRQEDLHLAGWINGQYIAASVGVNLSKKTKYPKKPYYMMAMENDDDDVHVLTDADRFMMFAMSFNAEHKDLKPVVIDGEAREINLSADTNNEPEGQ